MYKKKIFPSLFLAWRYVRVSAQKSSLSTMTKICFLSIAIGSFALTLVSAIMQGFESAMHDKLRGIHAHVIMQSDGQELAVDAISEVMTTEFPEVIANAPCITQHALLYAPETSATPLIAIIKGISPIKEQKTSSIGTKIIAGNQELQKALHDNYVIVGKGIADHLAVTVGDTITLAYSNDLSSNKRKVTFETTPLIINGIFETGIEDFDASTLFCHYQLLKTLFDDAQITTLNIRLHHGIDEEIVAKKIEQRFKISTYSWKSLYPALISALMLEKYAMFWILALITLVASANIIALLFMIITQKKDDIALLRTLGTPQKTIRAIFIIIGSMIANSACIMGIASAWIASFLINYYKLIALPDSYYISHLYAPMSLTIAFTVFSVVFCITLCATFIATKNIHYGKIADIMRQ